VLFHVHQHVVVRELETELPVHGAADLLALVGVRARQTYHASTQMGGGLYMRSVEEGTTFFIDPSLVLFASNVLVRNSVSSAHNKKNVSNIIVQRVLSAVNIDHGQVTKAEAMSRAHFDSETRANCV